MVSTQTLKLLDALLAGSGGSETDKLKTLYKDAFCSTESFRDIKTLLERSEFHGVVGKELLQRSEAVVQAGFSNAGGFGDSIAEMEYLVRKLQQERQRSEDYIKTSAINGEELSVIDIRLADQAKDYYEKLLQYVCCLYASLYGSGILSNLHVRSGIGSAELIRTMDDELSILLAEANRMEKPRVWQILRKTFGGLNMLRYSGFVLEYGSVDAEYLNEQCDRLTPTLFVPKTSGSDVVCCGVGYLTSLNVASGGTIFGARVTTEPAANCLDDLDINYRELKISLLLDKMTDGGVCILKPEQLVELLNRYFMIQAAKKNKESGCALCGGKNCRHVAIPRNFSMSNQPLLL